MIEIFVVNIWCRLVVVGGCTVTEMCREYKDYMGVGTELLRFIVQVLLNTWGKSIKIN